MPTSSTTWTRVPRDEAIFGGQGAQGMSSVTAGGPGLVAVGFDTSGRGAAVWTSPDGITWSRVPHDESVFGNRSFDVLLTSVTAGGPGLVAVGGAEVWTSPDGITWSQVPRDEAIFGFSQRMSSVTTGGPGLVAVGSDGSAGGDTDAAVWTSTDGITWSRIPHDESVFGGVGSQEMNSVTAGGPGLVAVGNDGLGPGRDAAVWMVAGEN